MDNRSARSLPFKDSGLYIFLIFLLFYTIIFTSVAVWRYENFFIGESGDLTIFAQVIHNTLHGRPFYSTIDGQNHFGVHNSPILALLVPFAAIFPVPYVLYAATVIAIAVSAIPIYLIARDRLESKTIAYILGLSYIMLPALVGQAYLSFHEINLVLPFISFAFYFFIKERFYPFMAMFFMGLMVKEDVSLTLFMFTVYAIIKKRGIKWSLFPAIFSILWLMVSIKVIIPYFDKSHGYPMLSYFPDLGSSFTEIITNTLFNPLDTFHRLTRLDKLFYLYVLLLPVGLILPCLSSEIIFVIPSLLLNMLAESSRFTFVHYETIWGQLTSHGICR